MNDYIQVTRRLLKTMFMSTLRVQFRMIHVTIQPRSNTSEMQMPCSENDSRNDVVITDGRNCMLPLFLPICSNLIKDLKGHMSYTELLSTGQCTKLGMRIGYFIC
jgi:hypothetical protein